MRQIITFLGKYPKETIYFYEGQEYTGQVFSQALREFVEFDQMLVFVTEEAKQTTWPVLEALRDTRIVSVDIPIGNDSDELWRLFDCLIENVGEGDTLIFDITHGLRSIPFLVFLAAAYLKTARNVTIEAILYGAYELGQPAPVIDLSEFVSLLDWLTATNQFVYTGDARYLAHLLTQEGEARNSSSLRTAGAKLDELSLAMMLCRPIEVMEKAGGLDRALAYAQHDLAQYTRPFALLADRIEREYADRALPKPTQNVEDSLRKQLALVHWYLRNNQVIQAMTLAREWVVTLTGWHLGLGFVLPRGDRETIEHGLGGIARMKRDGFTADDLNQVGRALWRETETAAMLQRLWNDITSVRNELNHAGMNPSPMKASKLVRKAREQIGPTLDELARAWGLTLSGGN